jgi:hypothetical protein
MSQEFDDYIAASSALNSRVEHKQIPIAVQGAGYSVSTVTYQRAPALVSVVASTGKRITPPEIRGWYGPMFNKLGALNAAGLKTNYPCVYFYDGNNGNDFILQVGFPVPQVPQPMPTDLIERRDPEHWCASVVLIGDFLAHIGHAWDAGIADVAKHGLLRSGQDREIYHHMTDFICTEVQIGLRDAPDLEERIRRLQPT